MQDLKKKIFNDSPNTFLLNVISASKIILEKNQNLVADGDRSHPTAHQATAHTTDVMDGWIQVHYLDKQHLYGRF